MYWFNKKNLIKSIYIILLFTLTFSWVFSGWPIKFDNIFFSNNPESAIALTAEIRPDGDSSIGWSGVTGSTCSGGHWCTLDEDPENTSDYISQSTKKSKTDDFTMTTISDVDSVTEVQVYVYCTKNHRHNGIIDVNLNINGADQTAQRIYPDDNNSWNWHSVNFSGLNLSQSDLDSLRVKLTSGKEGGRKETLYVSNVYASITYTTTQPNLNQIHYRWRNDDGGEEGGINNWYNENWGYRKKLSIDSSQVSGSSNLTNFPILINTTNLDWRDTSNSGHVGQSNGGDILFTSSDGLTKLDHEIESYDSTTGELVAWVKIPTLDYNDNTEIYIYYGNAGATDQENSSGVWGSEYQMVQHLPETNQGGGSYDDHIDSTSNNNDIETYGGLNMNALGKIDGADALSGDGSNDYMSAMDSTSLDITGDITMSMWVYANDWSNYPDLITKGDYTDSYSAWGRAGGSLRFAINNDYIESNGTVGIGGWHYLVFSNNNTTGGRKIYIDGSLDNSDTYTTSINTNNDPLYISSASYELDGTIDEVRVLNTSRSADWIATEYANQNSPSTFYSISTEETPGNSSATWAASEDTKLEDLSKNITKRLRFEISNEGTSLATSSFRLEVSGPNPTSCSAASYTRVDSSTHWDMTASTYFTDGDSTANVASGLTDENINFIAGEIKEDNDQTNSVSLNNTQFTELEFAIKATDNATDNADYCFRLTNAGSTTGFTYNFYGEVSLRGIPLLDQEHYRWRNDDGGEGGINNWYNENWGYRKQITIDNSQVSGSSNLTNFPILIHRTDFDWRDTSNSGHVGQSNGGDILFTSSDGLTKLDHEIESYNSTTGELVAWVKIPTLDYNDNTEIYIYYGNAGATNQENSSGVWDSNYKGVYHFSEGSSSVVSDSTSNNNNGSLNQTDHWIGSGLVGNAYDFDGNDDYVNLGTSMGSNSFTQITVEAWFNADSVPPWASIVTKVDDDNWRDGWGLTNGGNSNEMTFWIDRYNDEAIYTPYNNISDYYFFTGTYDGSDQKIYVNGNLEDTEADNWNNKGVESILIGAGRDNWGVNYHADGKIDEVRISNISRNASWIATEYNNYNFPSTFYSVAEEENYSTSATWAASEDTKLEDLSKNTLKRVRFEVSNSILSSASSSSSFKLQVAQTDVCGSGSYSDVPTDSSGHWQIVDSTYFNDGDSTYNISPGLTDEASNFVSGELKDAGNTTGIISLSIDSFTEIEFAVEATNNATDGANYCFRLYDANNNDTFYSYSKYAEAQLEGGVYLIQSGFRWFENNDSALASTTLAATNTAATLTSSGQAFRLRLLLHATSTDLVAGSGNYKLQFAKKSGTCDTNFIGENYQNITATTSIAFYNNPSPNDGDDVVLNPADDPVHEGHMIIGQTYEEANPFTSVYDISNGSDGLWDFSLIASSTPSDTTYCFRVVSENEAFLPDYLYIPEITTAKIYYATGYYISEDYDTGKPSVFNVIEWDWDKTSLGCSTCDIKFQIQTAPDVGGSPGAWSDTWCGPDGEDGDETDFFTVNTGQLIHFNHNEDQWIRYKATLYGDTSETPILENVKISYQ